jgi:hypothetical protein
MSPAQSTENNKIGLCHGNGGRTPRGWRGGLVVIATLCLLGLYSIALTHNHRSVPGALHCPVCQIAGHSPADLHAPDLSPMERPAPLLWLDSQSAATANPPRSVLLASLSRGPPSAERVA